MKLSTNSRALSALTLCAALIFSLVGFAPAANAQRRGGGGRGLVARAQSMTGDSFGFTVMTPRGARVYAVSRPRAELLRAVDDGLTELFAVARRHGYQAGLNHSDYTIFVARPDRTRNGDGAYSPDIALGAAQYAGSVYDKGGYVYAAGVVLSSNPPAFAIADHDRDFRRVSDVARYEGEHIVLYNNDRRLYNQTYDHSRGGSHPILK
jgi:hypothetical protein